jgi:hypothetical protein
MIGLMRRTAGWLVLLLLTTQAEAAEPRDAVFVVGALHDLHAAESAFDFEGLGRVIDAIQPDVLVLEVRPDELEGRLDTQGRPEYPAVVWPWLADHDVQAVAMEPGGAEFARITSAAGAQITALQARDPDAGAYRGRLRQSLETALQAYWTNAADTQNGVTADIARSWAITEAELVGAEFGTIQAEWDNHMLTQAQAAMRAHPGKRILVLGSYRNRAGLEAGLRPVAGGRLVDTEAWLRDQAFGVSDEPSSER